MCSSGFIRKLIRCPGPAGLPVVITLITITAPAFETDNFSLPSHAPWADIGTYLEAAHTIALQNSVAEVNARIEKALRIKDDSARTARLQRLHRPQAVLDAFMPSFGYPLFEDTQLERSLHGKWARQAYPGQLTSYQDLRMYGLSYFLLDPRRLMVLTQSRTVRAYGVYFGTDKIVHFHRLGVRYYRMYWHLVEHGLSKEEAYRKVVAHFATRDIFSEKWLFGTLLTAVYSNADLAANQSGFKFLLNLTENVVLKGEEREPLVIRCGAFWRLNQHVRLRSGWFSAFISDHWNEALNPSRYDPTIRPGIRRFLRSHADGIVRFYTAEDGRPNDPVYFDNLAKELSTYYGEPYGHSGKVETLLTIGNTCIPALRESKARN
jgi:hypothetical protein